MPDKTKQFILWFNEVINDDVGLVGGKNASLGEMYSLLTPKGIRTIEDINIGDEIWSGKKWTKIVNKWSTGIKKVYGYHTKAGILPLPTKVSPSSS